MHNSVVFSTFTELGNHHQILEIFITPKGNPISVCSYSTFPQISSSMQPLSIFCLYEFILEISYKWNHTICGFLYLASLTGHVFKAHQCCSIYLYSPFSLTYNIQLYGYTFYLFLHQLVGIWIISTFWLLQLLLL